MSWNQVEIAGGGILSPIQDSLTAVTDTLTAILETAKANATIAKMLAGLANPAMLALIALCDAVIVELEALRSGGLASILCHPWSDGITPKYDKLTGMLKLSMAENIAYIDRAFDDINDDERPSGSGEWGALVVVLSCLDTDAFQAALEKLGKFFDFDKLIKLVVQMGKLKQDKTSIDSMMPKEIDFYGISQAEMFPELDKALSKGVAIITGIKSLVEKEKASSDAIIAFIDAQIAEFTDLVTTWTTAITKLSASLVDPGIAWRFWPATANGLDIIRTDLKNSAEWPSGWNESEYTLIFGLFGGAPITVLKNLLGI